MKNITRILALVLALVMVIGTFASVSAAGAKWYDKAIKELKKYGVADLTRTAESKVTRAEFALWIAKIDSAWVNDEWWEENVLANVVVFKDQAETDKAHRAAICYCYQRNLVTGDGDGNYRPESTITLAEASVIITRLMGYENDVPQNGDQWQYNWMYTANKYCRAFDATFMSKVDTVNPDHELTNGEAAYLVATILNFLRVDGEDLRLTKKNEDLGKNLKPVSTSGDLVRVSEITMTSNDILVDTTKDVTLTILSTGETITTTGADFEKKVRVALGLKADRDLTVVDHFNLGDYVQKDTVLYATRKDGKLISVALFANDSTKVEANSYLVKKVAFGHEYDSLTGAIKTAGDYPKYANASTTDASKVDDTPEFPAAFASLGKFDNNGTERYAKEVLFKGNNIVFKGASEAAVEYKVVDNFNSIEENEIVVYDATNGFATMAAKAFKDKIYNLAEGEYKVTFYDIDSDGAYDIAVYHNSGKFTKAVTGAVNTTDNVVTATAYGNANDKAYVTANLASLSAGIITSVETSGDLQDASSAIKTIGGKKYFVVTISAIGNAEESKVVYVPVPAYGEDGKETYANRNAETSVRFTIEGYTRTGKVDSKEWTPFLDLKTAGTINDKLDAQAFKGLVYNKAVKYVLAGELDSSITGDAANVVVYLADTAAADSTKGFIVKVEKTETGTNTYNVTVATSGVLPGATRTHFDNVLDARFSYIATRPKGDQSNIGWTDMAVDTGITGDSTWTNRNVTPRLALEYAGFDADKYYANFKYYSYTKNELNPSKDMTKTWTLSGDQTGNIFAYARNILVALKATEADMATVYGMTLKQIDAKLDATVVDTAEVLGDDGVTVVTPAKTALEIAEAKGTTAWKLLSKYGNLKGLCVSDTMPNYKLDESGKTIDTGKRDKKGNIIWATIDNTMLRYSPDDYAKGKEIYETKTLGEILDDFAVFNGVNTFKKDVFFKNVVTNAQNVGTDTRYGYMFNFIGRMLKDGRGEKAAFSINDDGTYHYDEANLSKYLDSIMSAVGATGVKTFEVRASASTLWDVENAALYKRIFKTGTNAVLADQTDFAGNTKESVEGTDLIYVQIVKDGSAQNVLKIDKAAYEEGNETYSKNGLRDDKNKYSLYIGRPSDNNAGFSTTWYDKGYYVWRLASSAVKDSWTAYSSYIFLDDVNEAAVEKRAVAAIKAAIAAGGAETDNVRKVEIEDGDSKTTVWQYTETTADTRVAKDPYYKKTPAGNLKYEKHWSVAKVSVHFVVTQQTTGELKTYFPITDGTGAQVRVETEADKAYWENLNKDSQDVGARYEVIGNLLYRVNTVASKPKTDKDGNPVVKITYDVDYNADGTIWTDEIIKDEDLAKVKSVTARELDFDADKDTFKYGQYEVKFDGNTYYAYDDAQVIVMTPNPSTGNLDGSVTTLGEFLKAGKNLLVSREQVYYTTNENAKILKTLTVIGEYTDGIAKDDPITPEPEKTVTVYLGKQGATLEHAEWGDKIIVKSTYSAVKLPTGEAFGQIYREFETYAAATVADINTVMPAGFYVVKEDGKIVSANVALNKAYVTSADVKGGVTVKDAKTNGKDVKGDFEFFYIDFEGNFVKTTENTTKVRLVSKTVRDAKIAELKAAVATKTANYNAIDKKYVAAKAAAKEALDKAVAALETYQTSAITNNLNGQFWGGANSAAYTYFADFRYTYQRDPQPIEFQYITVDGVNCVVTNYFICD